MQKKVFSNPRISFPWGVHFRGIYSLSPRFQWNINHYKRFEKSIYTTRTILLTRNTKGVVTLRQMYTTNANGGESTKERKKMYVILIRRAIPKSRPRPNETRLATEPFLPKVIRLAAACRIGTTQSKN